MTDENIAGPMKFHPRDYVEMEGELPIEFEFLAINDEYDVPWTGTMKKLYAARRYRRRYQRIMDARERAAGWLK